MVKSIGMHALVTALALAFLALRTDTRSAEGNHNIDGIIDNRLKTAHVLQEKYSRFLKKDYPPANRICLPGADSLRLKGGGKARLYHRSFTPDGPWADIGGKVSIIVT